MLKWAPLKLKLRHHRIEGVLAILASGDEHRRHCEERQRRGIQREQENWIADPGLRRGRNDEEEAGLPPPAFAALAMTN